MRLSSSQHFESVAMGVEDHTGSWLALIPFVRELQQDFDPDWHIQWFEKNWTLSIYAATVYLLAIYFGRHAMERRSPFDLRRPLVLWNVFLTVFSICGVFSTVPNLIDVIRQEGFYYSVCISIHCYVDPHISTWGYLFAVSKLLELGDTFFIVARKTHLEFLHWYHHVTVMIFTWYATGNVSPLGQWFAGMNFFVHSIMYSYYSCKAARWSVPRAIARYITLLQLAQMFAGLFVLIYTFVQQSKGNWCAVHHYIVYAGLAIYASYAFLFLHFFYKRYMDRAKSKSA